MLFCEGNSTIVFRKPFFVHSDMAASKEIQKILNEINEEFGLAGNGAEEELLDGTTTSGEPMLESKASGTDVSQVNFH